MGGNEGPNFPRDMDAMNALVAKVRNTLARQRGLASEMRGDAKAWRVEA
jgi:hypothetical protein